MPSPERYATSNNSKHRSTGPRTEAGKARSKMNAWRHGLTGQVAVMPWEDQNTFEHFCKEIVDSLNTATPIERQLAQTIAEDHWRLNRGRAIENNILALGQHAEGPDFDTDNPEINTAFSMAQTFIANQKAFDLVTLYGSRINRDIRNNMAQLKQLQTERDTRRKAEMEEAAALRQAYKSEGLPYDDLRDRKGVTEEDDPFAAARLRGFVFSNARIDHYITRRSRLTLVKPVVSTRPNS